MKKFDVIIIGAGPAGYVAAIRCAQLGKNTALIDNYVNESHHASPGGTCLNVGCIPSKALLDSSKLFEQTQNDLHLHGISINDITENLSIDISRSMRRKQKIVSDLVSGISILLKNNNVTFYTAKAKLLENKHVEIDYIDKNVTDIISANHIILAPGSRAKKIHSVTQDGVNIVDSSGGLSFSKVPEKLAIIGAGVIGLELGSVWRRFGSKVTIFEYFDSLLPMVDASIAKIAQRLFKKQGLNFHYSTAVNKAEIENNTVTLFCSDAKGEYHESFNKVIVAVGREPNTDNLRADNVPLEMDKNGFIVVENNCETNLQGVYAIGDAVRGPMLAHKGSQEAVMVAELIAGQVAWVNYDTIPLIIYTEPEIACCGQTEQQLKEQNIRYNTGSFSFTANGRAKASGHSDGEIKVLADAHTDRVLGVHMIGAQVSELIAQVVIAMEFKASSEDLAMIIVAHPSLSEVLHEAALDVRNNSIHKLHSG